MSETTKTVATTDEQIIDALIKSDLTTGRVDVSPDEIHVIITSKVDRRLIEFIHSITDRNYTLSLGGDRDMVRGHALLTISRIKSVHR